MNGDGGVAIGLVFEAAEGGLAAERPQSIDSGLYGRIGAQGGVIVEVFIAETECIDALP